MFGPRFRLGRFLRSRAMKHWAEGSPAGAIRTTYNCTEVAVTPGVHPPDARVRGYGAPQFGGSNGRLAQLVGVAQLIACCGEFQRTRRDHAAERGLGAC